MTKPDAKAHLRKLSGMDDEELKQVREASIERLQLLGFKKIDEMMIAISSAQLIQELNEFKKKCEIIYQEAIAECLEKELLPMVESGELDNVQ